MRFALPFNRDTLPTLLPIIVSSLFCSFPGRCFHSVAVLDRRQESRILIRVLVSLSTYETNTLVSKVTFVTISKKPLRNAEVLWEEQPGQLRLTRCKNYCYFGFAGFWFEAGCCALLVGDVVFGVEAGAVVVPLTPPSVEGVAFMLALLFCEPS